MRIPTIAFDESGNTGEDLLNPDQPVFTLAAVCLDDATAAAIATPLYSTQSKELHFKRLRGSPGGQDKILQLLEHPALTSDTGKLSISIKSFFVTTKMVDLLIETTMRKHRNHDIYKDGENISLANMLHWVLPRHTQNRLFLELGRRFVLMMRKRAGYEVDKFYDVAGRLYRDVVARSGDRAADALFPIVMSKSIIDFVLKNSAKWELDPVVPAFVELSNAWGKQLGTRFDVLFDASKTIEHEKAILEAISHPAEPETEVGYDRRKVVYPLKVNSLRLVESHLHPQIQIADVLGSAAGYWIRQRTVRGGADEFADRIERAILKKKFQTFILAPQDKLTPEELGTTAGDDKDPHAHIHEMLLRRLPREGIP